MRILIQSNFPVTIATLCTMPAYIVVNAKITDPDGLAAYRVAVGPTFDGHPSTMLVSNNEAVSLEGEPHGSRVVIIRFPDRAAAMAWYESPAYQAIIGLRHASTEGSALLVDGLDDQPMTG